MLITGFEHGMAEVAPKRDYALICGTKQCQAGGLCVNRKVTTRTVRMSSRQYAKLAGSGECTGQVSALPTFEQRHVQGAVLRVATKAQCSRCGLMFCGLECLQKHSCGVKPSGKLHGTTPLIDSITGAPLHPTAGNPVVASGGPLNYNPNRFIHTCVYAWTVVQKLVVAEDVSKVWDAHEQEGRATALEHQLATRRMG